MQNPLSRPALVTSLILLVALVLSGPVLAAKSARVKGSVVDDQGKPVAGMAVKLVPLGTEEGNLEVQVTTKKSGKFLITAVTVGAYYPQLDDREHYIKSVKFIGRGPDGSVVAEFGGEELQIGSSVPSFQLIDGLRAEVQLVIAEGQANRPDEASIQQAKDDSGVLGPLNELFDQGDWPALLEEADKVVASNPELGGAHYLRAVALWQTRQLADAAEGMRRTAEVSPEQPGILGTLGSVLLEYANELREAGQEEQAKPIYLEAADYLGQQLEENPESITYLTNRVIALDYSGDKERTIEALRLLIDARPESMGPFFRLAELLSETGKPQEAIEVIEQLPAGSDDAAMAIYNAAVDMWNDGNMQATILAMDKAIVMAPEIAVLYRLKARANVNLGNNAEAIVALENYLSRVAEDDPESEIDRKMLAALKASQ